jgi:histidine decarboxylase
MVIPDIDKTNVDDIENIVNGFMETLQDKSSHHMGYPYNLKYDYKKYGNLLNFSINNLGDPFVESNYGSHTRMFEIAILDWFAQRWDITRDDYWGYVTCCGTEGNLHGIYLGRENYPNGILYTSEESHYSIPKAARMFRMKCEIIKCNDDGSMDLAHFRNCLVKNKGSPAIVNLNIGTTFKGAIDDIDGAVHCLYDCGYKDDDFYIHCDGALVGLMVSAFEGGFLSFKKPIGSISVSGHKLLGSPIPCGIIITRKKHIIALSKNNNVDYIRSVDTTIMGSRAGLPCVFIWDYLVRNGWEGIKHTVNTCVENAQYLADSLRKVGVKRVILNKWSNTVVFEAPSLDITRKWQLATTKDLCHIVVMPNIGKEKIDKFIQSL